MPKKGCPLSIRSIHLPLPTLAKRQKWPSPQRTHRARTQATLGCSRVSAATFHANQRGVCHLFTHPAWVTRGKPMSRLSAAGSATASAQGTRRRLALLGKCWPPYFQASRVSFVPLFSSKALLLSLSSHPPAEATDLLPLVHTVPPSLPPLYARRLSIFLVCSSWVSFSTKRRVASSHFTLLLQSSHKNSLPWSHTP